MLSTSIGQKAHNLHYRASGPTRSPQGSPMPAARSGRRSGACPVREQREWRAQHWPKDIILKPLLRQSSAWSHIASFWFWTGPQQQKLWNISTV
eukprot:scaffold6565_cov93-Cylindrotheca_fusiformis.AAC.1